VTAVGGFVVLLIGIAVMLILLKQERIMNRQSNGVHALSVTHELSGGQHSGCEVSSISMTFSGSRKKAR
jgi:hypothetical protein